MNIYETFSSSLITCKPNNASENQEPVQSSSCVLRCLQKYSVSYMKYEFCCWYFPQNDRVHGLILLQMLIKIRRMDYAFPWVQGESNSNILANRSTSPVNNAWIIQYNTFLHLWFTGQNSNEQRGFTMWMIVILRALETIQKENFNSQSNSMVSQLCKSEFPDCLADRITLEGTDNKD